MPQKPFIKNIDQLVKNKLKELKLKPELALLGFIEKDKRFYATPCQTETGTVVFFKMLISAESPDPALLKKEIILTKLLSDHAKNNKDFPVLCFIKADIENQPYWLIRQYLPGPIIGYHFEIFEQGQNEAVIKSIINNLLLMQSISLENRKNDLFKITLLEKTYQDYLNTLKKFENQLKLWKQGAFYNKLNFKAIYQFFEAKKNYLNKKDLVLAHGDLTLANFFINQNKVYLTDWEHARKDNLAADIARLWIQTYRYSKWRKSLVENFVSALPTEKRNIAQESFCLIALTEAMAEYFCELLRTTEDTPLKQSTQQTIMLAQKGFEWLLNS